LGGTRAPAVGAASRRYRGNAARPRRRAVPARCRGVARRDRRRVEADLDRAGLTTVHLVGNSLGGWVALELACRGRIRSVVLFGPGGAWGPPRGTPPSRRRSAGRCWSSPGSPSRGCHRRAAPPPLRAPGDEGRAPRQRFPLPSSPAQSARLPSHRRSLGCSRCSRAASSLRCPPGTGPGRVGRARPRHPVRALRSTADGAGPGSRARPRGRHRPRPDVRRSRRRRPADPRRDGRGGPVRDARLTESLRLFPERLPSDVAASTRPDTTNGL